MDQEMAETFRESVRYWRVVKGISAHKLAYAIGETNHYRINDWDSGATVPIFDRDEILEISEVLGVSLKTLVQMPPEIIPVTTKRDRKLMVGRLEEIRKAKKVSSEQLSLAVNGWLSTWSTLRTTERVPNEIYIFRACKALDVKMMDVWKEVNHG